MPRPEGICNSLQPSPCNFLAIQLTQSNRRKQMLKISTFRFQFYLSITDLLVLSICATNALLEFGFNIDLKIKSDSVCRIHTFLSSLLRHLSSVLLMMVNVERLMVVLNSKSILGGKSPHHSDWKIKKDCKTLRRLD